jgi:hypothetical protein
VNEGSVGKLKASTVKVKNVALVTSIEEPHLSIDSLQKWMVIESM